MINLINYGFTPNTVPQNSKGIPARVTAVHKERYVLIYDCERTKAEPGCAIKAAIESGALSLDRWESYYKIRHEADFSYARSAFLREKNARNKSIAIHNKQKKRNIDTD